jgi:hypothetical protein
VVVILASVIAQIVGRAREAVAASGVPVRTLRRWGSWWREVFPRLPTWAELRARFAPPPPDEAQLPRSLFTRLGGEGLANAEALLLTARYLAPATSDSVVEGSRFVTAALAELGPA